MPKLCPENGHSCAKKLRLRRAAHSSGEDGNNEAQFRDLGGSASDDCNRLVGAQTLISLSAQESSREVKRLQAEGTLAALRGISPKDELEGLMASQLIAAHKAMMECYRRAMITDQTFDGRRENLNQANKLSCTWATLLDALNKHRGKGQPKVPVEHVHAGAQAGVGTGERPRGRGSN